MARLLVTGGAGYVGSHCVKTLTAAGHDCVIFDNLSSGHRNLALWGIFVEGDIRDAGALERAFSTHQIDAVMHFAALSSIAESTKSPERYYDANVNGTRVLLEAMRRASVGKIVFSSSCAIYGVPATFPIDEDTVPMPINPYGFSKLVCERMIADFGSAHGLRWACLRYFNAAGADPQAEIGEDHVVETRLIPLALDTVSGRRNALSLFGTDYPTPDGTAIRDYVHVCDLAEGHVAALRHLIEGSDNIAVNFGTANGASVRQVLDVVRKVTKRELAIRMSPARQGDPPMLVADPGKAREILGWRPLRSDLETIVADAWRWHQHRFAHQS